MNIITVTEVANSTKAIIWRIIDASFISTKYLYGDYITKKGRTILELNVQSYKRLIKKERFSWDRSNKIPCL